MNYSENMKMTDKSDERVNHFSRWFVVNTHTHKEHIALENLLKQGFTSYCPLMRRRIKHARRSQDVLRPLFPGYVFVQAKLGIQAWRPILSTIGVKTLIRFGERPGVLDDRFIQSFKAREIDGAIVRPTEPFAVGQQVRLCGGAFDGLVATIISLQEKDRLVVLMDLLNQSVHVKTSAQNVMAV